MKRPAKERFRNNFEHISLSLFENYLDDKNSVYMHYHNRLEIIHVLNGEGIVSVDLNEYQIAKDDLLLIAPNQIHSIRGMAGCVLHCQTLVFQSDDFSSLDGCIFQTHIPSDKAGNHEFCTLHALIFHICNTGPHGAENVIKSLLFSLCGMISYYHFTLSSPPAVTASTASLKEVLAYMHENYADKIELESLATIAGYSKCHFNRFFSAATGYTCIQYLHMLRLRKAKKLLRTTTYKLDYISELSGFKSVSYLIRIFKREEGKTPLQYRIQSNTIELQTKEK